MQYCDIESVVQVHLNAFQGFFLTFLGPSFLREFYSSVCVDPSGIAVVYDDNSVIGFVVGTVQPAGFYRRLIQKRWWKFGLASLRPVLRKPSIIPRLLRAFAMPSDVSNAQPGTATLMSLAVMRNYQGQGIGKQLVSAFIECSRKRQIEVVNLTTDAAHNIETNEFYQRMGFRCSRAFTTPEGRLMNEYMIEL